MEHGRAGAVDTARRMVEGLATEVPLVFDAAEDGSFVAFAARRLRTVRVLGLAREAGTWVVVGDLVVRRPGWAAWYRTRDAALTVAAARPEACREAALFAARMRPRSLSTTGAAREPLRRATVLAGVSPDVAPAYGPSELLSRVAATPGPAVWVEVDGLVGQADPLVVERNAAAMQAGRSPLAASAAPDVALAALFLPDMGGAARLPSASGDPADAQARARGRVLRHVRSPSWRPPVGLSRRFFRADGAVFALLEGTEAGERAPSLLVRLDDDAPVASAERIRRDLPAGVARRHPHWRDLLPGAASLSTVPSRSRVPFVLHPALFAVAARRVVRDGRVAAAALLFCGGPEPVGASLCRVEVSGDAARAVVDHGGLVCHFADEGSLFDPLPTVYVGVR